MASSSDAFEKFSRWNKDKTWLNVTIIERGQPERASLIRLIALDSDALLIAAAGKEMHWYERFDVRQADFSVESDRVVVSRDDLEWLIFEVADL